MRSTARFERPAQQATEPRAKREARSILCHSLMVDSTFEQSENIAITRPVRAAVLAGSEGCGLGHNSIGSKFGATFICACTLY